MVASVNSVPIDENEVTAEFDRLKPHYDEHVRADNEDASDEQLMEWARENVIERMLIRQSAEKEPPVDPEEVKTAYESIMEQVEDAPEDEVKHDIELNMKIERLVNRIQDEAPEITEEQCRRWYEENRDQFQVPEQVRVRHIVKHVDGLHPREEAYSAIQEVKMQLDQGADFEELAREHSDCADDGGDLGYFPRGQMVEEFEDVVFNMTLGDVSDIFLTQFGYHIAKLEDRVGAGPVPFEEAGDRIAERLAEEARQDAINQYVDQLKAEAEIVRE